MVKQYFILGRNPILSLQEITSYADARKLKPKEIFLTENMLLMELEKEIDINKLGGTIKSGLIEKEGNEETVFAHIISQELIPQDKFTYSTYGNVDEDIFKSKFKMEKRKAILKHGRRRIKFQDQEKTNLKKADFYLILHHSNNIFYFGKINQEYNPKPIEFRDMNKPVRREHLAISPRLSKILINLSGAKEKEELLDPFCGVAGIVSESILLGINAYASDNDLLAIRDAKKNIAWLKLNYDIKARAFIKKQDARKIPDKSFDAIATETPLGEVLRKKPTDQKAKTIIRKFEGFIIPVLRNLKKIKKQDAKIAITFPKIFKNTVDLERIEDETGLKTVIGPITESREKQIIERQILVFV